MYNIRKKLTILAVFMFAASVTLNIAASLARENETAASGAPETDAEDTSSATAEYSALFGDDESRFVAHRGYSAAAPENTALAFELAGKSMFWGIETDISQTYDGEFVCMHDDELDRTTNGTGPVSRYTYESLQELTIDSGANTDRYPGLKIPSMVEFLNICVTYGCIPIIEIKNITDYDKFLQTIYDSNLETRCIVTGGIEDLSEIRVRNNDIMLMVIGYSNKDYAYYSDLMSNIGGVNNGVLYNYPVVTKEVVGELHALGLVCGVWSLDTAEDAQTYLDYGADFIVTNEIPASLDLMINTTE